MEGAPFRRNGASNKNCFTSQKPKIWGDFNSIWATEEFKTVHGPNLNPEWITWNESEFSGPSVKVKEEKY